MRDSFGYDFSEKEAAVFSHLTEILSEVIGADMVEIIGVRRESAFVRDLEMDSIQVVAFAERINEFYGRRVNFVGWLSKKPLRKVINLTVGEVAAFIAKEI